MRSYEPLLMTLLRGADAFMGAVFFILLNAYFDMHLPHNKEAAVTIFFFILITFHIAGLYRSWRFSSLQYEISQILNGCFILYTILFLVVYFLKISTEFSRVVVIHWIILWPLLLSVERMSIRSVLRYYRKKGYSVRKAVIAGSGKMGAKIAKLIKGNPWSGTWVEGVFDDTTVDMTEEGLPVLGCLDALPEYVTQHKIDIVYLALSMQEEAKIKALLQKLTDSTVSIFFVPDIFFLDLVMGGGLVYFENFPVIALQDTPFMGINSLIKRMEDVILAAVILLLTSPLFVLIAIAIKGTSRGPVIFKQHRYGLNGDKFIIYKFRTMTVCEDGYMFTQATQDDPRVTPLGKFLRNTSLDELPQFINVMQGRMSIVGPRPHPVAMNEEYRKIVPGYMLRHKVKPGITGLAQIHGFRGETDTLEKMENRIKYDLEYLRQWSLLLDLKIILKTIISGAWRTNAV